MPWRRMKALEKALELSSCAAALVGPKMRRPWARNSSTTPAASGASGPTTVRPIFCSCAHSRSFTTSVIGKFSNLVPRVPPLPGATKTRVALGDWASFQASACSRPPPPMTSIFMDGVPDKAGSKSCVVEDVLHVVEFFNHVQELLHPGGVIASQLHSVFCAHGDLGHLGHQACGLQGIFDGLEVSRCREHFNGAFFIGNHILGTCFQSHFHDLVFTGARSKNQLPDVFKLKG